MTLLELPEAELRQKIDSALASNPALEITNEIKCPGCNRFLPKPGRCPECSRPKHESEDQPIIFVSPRSSVSKSNTSYQNSEEYTFSAGSSATSEDLPT